MHLFQRLRRKFAAGLLILGVGLVAAPTLALAQDEAPIAAEDVGREFVIANPVWSIITGVLLPLVVGLITKASANDRFQAIVGIIVAAVGALVVRATTVDGSAVLDSALVLDIFLVYAPQLLVYLGVYKKFDLNQKLAPTKGVG